MDGYVNGWMHGQMDGCVGGWNGWMGGWMDVCVFGWIDVANWLVDCWAEWMDGWVPVWLPGSHACSACLPEVSVFVCVFLYVCTIWSCPVSVCYLYAQPLFLCLKVWRWSGSFEAGSIKTFYVSCRVGDWANQQSWQSSWTVDSFREDGHS